MADVLIVCVREDETQAKALADMFEAAGFSVGGAPSNDGALRSSGAGVVVWSQSSIRSRPFLDAAQRVINAGKGVLACLIEPPPADSVNDSPAFDLSNWSGDANDPSLDPLFFAVDRMVNSARAAVGADPEPRTIARSEGRGGYEAPISSRSSAPPYARPRTPPTPPPQIRLPAGFQTRNNSPSRAPFGSDAASNDPLGSEAEQWRAIRHSKDPTAFLDYLARYGPEGAFAELAEFRLKQLEGGGGQSPLRDAARAAEPTRNYNPPLPRRPEPQRSYEPPARSYEPRRPEPPPRRPDPPPVPRRQEPRMERDYRPPAEVRDTPRAGGGFLRALVLIVLLGGAAFAGSIYFGLGDKLQTMLAGSSTEESGTHQSASTEPASAPLDSTAAPTQDIPPAQVVGMGPAGTSSPAVAPPRQRPVQVASNTPRSQPQQRRDTRQQQQDNAPPPAPQTSWSAPGSNGPTSLLPGSTSSAPVTIQQPPPQVAVSTTVPAAPTPAGVVQWSQRPTGDQLASVYPRNAMRDQISGSAQLDCVVRSDLGVACTVAGESPANAGFGRAAINVASNYRARPQLSNGASSVGSRTRLSMSFRAPRE